MSSFGKEQVLIMPPMSTAAIERKSIELLQKISPETLSSPKPLDILHLAEYVLPQIGIHVGPGSNAELVGCEAFTDPDGKDGNDINILLREDSWNQLLAGGRDANRVRATIAHEIGHAILHVPVIRGSLSTLLKGQTPFALTRSARENIPAYKDPEWQAWTMAGCLLAPRRTILMMADLPVEWMADVYEISPSMMESHLKKLKMTRKFSNMGGSRPP